MRSEGGITQHCDLRIRKITIHKPYINHGKQRLRTIQKCKHGVAKAARECFHIFDRWLGHESTPSPSVARENWTDSLTTDFPSSSFIILHPWWESMRIYSYRKHQETSRNIKKHQETSRHIKKKIKKHQETSRIFWLLFRLLRLCGRDLHRPQSRRPS